MAEENKKVMTKEEYDALPEATKESLLSKGILRDDITPEVMASISKGRYDEAQKIISSNKEKEDAQRDINFAKNDVYNAGMAANVANKIGTLSRDANKNKEELAESRKTIETPLAIRNAFAQQMAGRAAYNAARGLGADVIGNRNALNNQSYLNALGAAAQSSNQAGNFGSQNQALFNKKLMADKGVADMQLQYQNIANQDLGRATSALMQEDATQNRFNANTYAAKAALQASDIRRGENRKDAYDNAIRETYDTVPYLASKWTGDYTNMSQQRNLDPNRRFMNNHLFAKSRQNPYINGGNQAMNMGNGAVGVINQQPTNGVPMYLNANTQRQPKPNYYNNHPNMQRYTPEYLDVNTDPFYQEDSIYKY